MRTEKEMMDLIIGIAKKDKRIRAVYMNGSRTNPNVIKDDFQDYDIVYMVTETETFLKDENWISMFGEPAIIEKPNREEPHKYYTWLILFKDGNRIDLNIRIKECALEEYTKDSLTLQLLDKDNCLPKIPDANDSDYFIKKPSEDFYKSRCNDFWWCLQNVAKGIARDQINYAMWMYNVAVRDNLNKIIDWYIGVNNNFNVSVGMCGKEYKKFLPENIYVRLLKTYSGSDYDDLWNAVFCACELFSELAVIVSDSLGYEYNKSDETNMMEYMKKVKDSNQ